MSIALVVGIVVAAVVVLAIAGALAAARGGGPAGSPVGVKRRFGPEYTRTLARHDGDAKATRRELTERVKRYGRLERPALSEEARERYAAGWAAAQGRFVDDPAGALNDADRLLGALAAERGFPDPRSPEHFDALSVHHPHEVQGYRYAHTLAEHGPAGPRGTEELRQALLGARTLYDALTAEAAAPPAPAAIGKAEKTEEAEEAGEAEVTKDAGETGPERRGPLAHRLAALTGGRRGRTGDHP